MLLLCSSLVAWRAGAVCVGDCNNDGEVTIDDILRGVNLALGSGDLSLCSSIDRDGSGEVTVDEIVAAVNAALSSCPIEATPTPMGNQAPQIVQPAVYRGYVGFPIALPITVSDPEGGTVRCTADELPAGASLDSLLLSWTPSAQQVGPAYASITCVDDDPAPGSATVLVPFSIRAVDSCSEPVCAPAVGCSSPLPALAAPCCSGEAPLAEEPDAPCPGGLALLIVDDSEGPWNVLSNCESKVVKNFAQTGAQVRVRLLARCINLDDRSRVRGHMETANRVMFTREYLVPFTDAGGGYVQSPVVPFQVDPPAPFFDIQDAEANLTITLRDPRNQEVSQSVHLRLTFTPMPAALSADKTAPTPTP
jgi:hypothetical protein